MTFSTSHFLMTYLSVIQIHFTHNPKEELKWEFISPTF